MLLAWNEADPLQGGQMLLRLGQVIDDQIGLAHVLVRAPMPGIEHERALVMLERELELPRVAIRVAEVVLDVGVARVTKPGGGQ